MSRPGTGWVGVSGIKEKAGNMRSGAIRAGRSATRVGMSVVAAVVTLVLVGEPAVAIVPTTGVTCQAIAGSEAESLELAQACDREVENLAARTPWSTTTATTDGTLISTVSTVAQRTATTGQWTPVDTRVVDGVPGDGRLVPRAPVYPITLSDGTPGQPLVTITRDGHTLTYDAPFDLTTPVVDGGRVTYPAVAGAGADLIVTVNDDGTGFATTLLLADRAAAKRADKKLGLDTLTFPVTTTPGLLVSQAGTSGFQVSDTSGKRLFSAPQPRMWDSAAAAGSPTTAAVVSPRAAEAGVAQGRGPRGWEHVAGSVKPDDTDARLTAPLPGDATEPMKTTLVPAAPRHDTGASGATRSSGAGETFGAPGVSSYAVPGDLTVGGQPVESAGGFGAQPDQESRTTGVRVRLDQDMLTDPGTVWPVLIDPVVTSTGNEWLMIHEPVDGETAQYMFDGNQGLGMCQVSVAAACGNDARFRLAWQFTGLDHLGLLDPESITSATFAAYGDHSWDCVARTAELWRTGQFDAASTWASFSTQWQAKLSVQTVAHKPACDNSRWIEWDATAGAKYLASSDTGTLTLGLKALNESDMTQGWKRYRHDAQLTIEYTPAEVDTRAEGADLLARQDNLEPVVEDAASAAPSPAPANPVSPSASPEPSPDPSLVPEQDTPEQASTQVPVPAELTPIDPATLGGLDMAVGAPPADEATGETPVPAAEVQIDVADQAAADAAGVTGVLLDVIDTTASTESASSTAAAEDGTRSVQVQIGYADFKDLAGANWSGRLGIVRIPACAETTPEADECQPIAVDTANDTDSDTLTATLDLAASGTTTAPTATSSTRESGDLDLAKGQNGLEAASTADAAAAATSGDTFAVTGGTSSASGDWGATPLSPSSAWSVSGATGSLGWTYPLTVPDPAAGPSPDLAIGYSSGSLDGRVSGVNNQSSWIGDGWDLTSGFVERRYTPCVKDRGVVDGQDANNSGRKTGDLCWDTDNAYLVFNGASTELVKDDDPDTTNVIEWVGKSDDGTRVQQYSAGSDSARSGEYWRVTTTDGSEYFFGKDERYSGDTLAQNSRWTVPVYGNHPGEPGHATAFKDSQIQLGWRFMLDYARDTSGNSMTYRYAVETNRYGANNNTGDTAQYTRGGTLDWISYGTRAGSEPTAADGAGAPYLVDFNVKERCLASTGCEPGDLTKASSVRWHDTPADLRCTSTTSCKDVQSPAFFSTKRLSSVTTNVRVDGAWRPVTTWDLTHAWRDPGDGTGRFLWLSKIGRVAHGQPGTSDDVRFDPVTFSGGQQLPARVNDTITDGYPEMNRIRVTGITTETGGTIGIEYTPAQCTRSSHPVPSDWKIPEATQRDNTSRCFPMTWTPWGEKQRTEWFHTYLVKTITQSPGQDAALGPQVRTTYDYSGGMAWAKVDDPLVAKKDRTWSEMRGYETVTTTTGSGDADKVSARYLRGMGGTLTVDSALTSRDATDEEAFAGQTLVTTTYNGDTPVSTSVTIPTATEVARTGSSSAGDLLIASRLSRADTYTGIYDASGSLEHVTRTDASYNPYGQVTSLDDHGAWSSDAERNDTTDDQCTRTTYLVAEAAHLVVPKDTESVSVACASTPTRPDDVVTAVRYAYDDQEYGSVPTDGLVTQTTQLDSDTGTFTTNSPVLSATYDQRGRPTSATDALGRLTGTTYTESAGVLTRVTTTSPDPDGPGDGDGDGITLTAHTQTTTLDPVSGLPVTVTDANGRDTQAVYDAAGRLTSVTYPDRAGKTPNITYAYTTSARGINTITTKTLAADGIGYHAVVELFDGQLRPIQVQTESLDGHTDATIGRLVVDTQYDDLGRVRQTTSPWYTTGRPAASLVAITTVPDATTRYTYDAAGRTTAEILYLGNPDNPDYEAWRTKTVYDGTTTTVIPPAGGVPTQTITDARGRAVTMRQYLRDPQADAAADTLAEIADLASQDTTYRYDHAGRLRAIADTADNEWTYEYDWLGRQVEAEDPDAGTTITTYDKAGQVTVVDHEMGELRYTYDQLGRRTTMRYGWSPDTVRSRWYYDVLHSEAGPKAGQVVKGQPTASVRYDGTAAYITATTGFDAAYRPTGEVTVIPDVAANEGLAGRYETSATYTADGQIESVTYGAAGNLNQETVTTHYNKASAPEWMGGGFGWGTYVATSRHDVYGRLSYLDLGNTYGTVVSYLYQDGTNRLTNMRLDRERIGGTELDLRYTYDAAGNVTSIKDKPTAQGRVGDQQCFQYDALRQLTEAWTPATGNCGLAKSIPGLGGASPYWQSFEYDSVGNRTTQTYRTPGGEGDGLVTTTDYSYDGPRDKNNDGDTTDLGEYAGPHSATQIETTGPDGDVRVDIGYDAAGGMYEQTTTTDYASVLRKTEFYMERELHYTYVESTLYPEPEPGSGDDDSDGDQADDPAPEPGTGVTTREFTANLYTADGERLTRTSPDGSVTAYVGGQEVTRSPSGQVTATRYYAFAGQSVAMRTANGLGGVTTLVSDHHGTPVATVHNTNWTTSSVDKHYTLPFGTARGGAVTPGDHEFLGKTEDATTGLTHIGARWYDDTQGRFLTVDPLLDPANPQMLNAYAYANNNPTTFSDPTGLLVGPLIDGNYSLTQQANKAFQNPVKAPNTSWAPRPTVPPRITPPVTTSPTTSAGRAATQVATRAAAKAATKAIPIVGVIVEMIIFAPAVGDATCPVAGCTNSQPSVTVSSGATTAVETGTVDVTPAPKDTLGGGNPGQGSNGKGGGGGSGTKTTFADPADDGEEEATGDDAANAPDPDIPVVRFSRAKMPEIAKNFDRAVAQGKPTVLTRASDAAKRANRAAALRGLGRAGKGYSWDEYPFASSTEGGSGALVARVPVVEQNIQGGTLSSFFQNNGVSAGNLFRIVFEP